MKKWITLFVIATIGLYANEALDIMKKVDNREDGKTIEQDMLMVLIDKNNQKRIRTLNSYGKDYGEDEKRILFFKTPADVTNTAFLTYDWDDSNKDDDQWLYLPALNKTKRIPSSDKSSSFMGSDFSYSDMTDKNLEDYDFTLMKEVTFNNIKHWMIKGVPIKQKTIDETGYKQSILLIDQRNYVLARAIHFEAVGSKTKYFTVNKMHEEQGIWLIDEMQMITKQGKRTLHKTILQFNDIKLNQKLEDGWFTTRRLEKGI